VDEQARGRGARRHLVEDPVEGHLAVAEVAEVHAQDEEGRRHPAGDSDLDVAQLLPRERLLRHDDRAVAGAHARAVRQQDVLVLDERVRVERQRRDLEPSVERPEVQRLDVLQDVLELEVAGVDLPRRERPEHERVVGIRAVSEPDQHERGRLAGLNCETCLRRR
jgi:hypothetical protein